ncbi:MAG: FKBP-type peptidyl-prolyl cis-trans isomerase [Pseudomonadota bacterium]
MTTENIKPGKFISLTYSIVDENGNVLEQSDLPVSYVYGSDTELIGGMDEAMLGKKAGDKILVEVPPAQGFGEHDPDLTFTDDLNNVPPEFRRIGAEVEMQNESGESRTFYVTRIEDGRLTVDGNHPMAGKTLTVQVKIQDVREATAEDAAASGIHSIKPGAIH